MLLDIDFVFKMDAVLDLEEALMQIRKYPRLDIQLLKIT